MKKLCAIAFMLIFATACDNNAKAMKTKCGLTLKSCLNQKPSKVTTKCPSGSAYKIEAGADTATGSAKTVTCPVHGISLRADGAVK